MICITPLNKVSTTKKNSWHHLFLFFLFFSFSGCISVVSGPLFIRTCSKYYVCVAFLDNGENVSISWNRKSAEYRCGTYIYTVRWLEHRRLGPNQKRHLAHMSDMSRQWQRNQHNQHNQHNLPDNQSRKMQQLERLTKNLRLQVNCPCQALDNSILYAQFRFWLCFQNINVLRSKRISWRF